MTQPRSNSEGAGVPEGPRYVALAARPPRLAVFVQMPDDAPWERFFEMALAAQSRLWGGSANLIIPVTGDLVEHPLFWALAERFDADYFVSAAFTCRDVGIASPGWMDQWEAAQLAAIERDVPNIPPDERDVLLETARDDGAMMYEPDPSLMGPVVRRLAPFHHVSGGLSFNYRFRLDEQGRRSASWSGRAFAHVTQVRDWPGQVVNATTSLGDAHQLLLTATFGRLPSGFADLLSEEELALVAPRHVHAPAEWRQAVLSVPQEGVAFPWNLAETGLGWYGQGPFDPPAVTLVAGGSAWDFALFLALRRWRLPAFWLPQSLIADADYVLGLGTAMVHAREGGHREVGVVTASDEGFRDEAAVEIARVVEARAADWREVLPQSPPRLVELHRPGRHEPVAMDNGTTVELQTPVPAGARQTGGEVRWLTDVRMEDWMPIRHGALGGSLFEHPPRKSEDARTGRRGLTYVPQPPLAFAGASLEMTSVRPRLRPLTLIAQLDVALRSTGWSCRASDKGAYAAESAALFGGFRQLATALTDRQVRGVIDAFNAGSPHGRRASGRTYLALDDIRTVVGDAAVAERVCDDLTESGVLTRGLFLKCARCRAAGWYHLADVSTTFTCQRCRNVQRLSRDRWLGSSEPPWYYERAEVVRALLEHNGDLPVIAVHRLFADPQSRDDDIEVAFEIEMTSPDGERSELDIAVREGSTLWLGEATTKDHLEKAAGGENKRLRRLRAVADLLAARGVILASSTEFRQSTRNRATSTFAGDWPALRFEERVETHPAV